MNSDDQSDECEAEEWSEVGEWDEGPILQYSKNIIQADSHNFLLDMKISLHIHRKKFGELFYRVIIMDLKDHAKGMLIESAVLLGKIYGMPW